MNLNHDCTDHLAASPIEELPEGHCRLSRMCLPFETLERSKAYQDALWAAVDRMAFEKDDEQ